MAITDDDRERAFDAYSHFAWDPAVSFSVNWSEIESLVSEMKRVGVDSALIPNRRKMYARLRLTMLRVLPQMRTHFDYVQRTGGPASGNGSIDSKHWTSLWVALS